MITEENLKDWIMYVLSDAMRYERYPERTGAFLGHLKTALRDPSIVEAAFVKEAASKLKLKDVLKL
jgi:hypothetical protein